MKHSLKSGVALLSLILGWQALPAQALIPAAHLYHDHMPNFWPYYANSNADAIAQYNALAVGAPIAYTYDGQVINLKTNPPAGYPYMIPTKLGGGPMPHDNLVTDYSANAKYQCYESNPPNNSGHGWPMAEAEQMQTFSGGTGQVHVNFSAALANDVNSIETLDNISGLYNEGAAWNSAWLTDYTTLQTKNGFHTLDIVHFGGHHPLGPLVGQDFLLKDLIFHGATLAQPWFLGSSYKSSHGFFPTELSFSERLIPVLSKMGITWSVMGNNHFSRSLSDYPYATYDATGDASDSPPNRAELRDTSTIGAWTSGVLFNNPNITIVNKFPFGSTPHYVRYVDPVSGAATQVAGIPVSQLGEWQEGYTGSITVDEYLPYVGDTTRQQFFVIAHDGDNSSGRSGSQDTWQAGTTVTGAGDGYNLGIDEYLNAFPIPSTDVQHVQDGSWPDVTDASTDPEFLHWRLPFSINKNQFALFNSTTGMSLAPKKNLKGLADGNTVSLEDGWGYQEINYAKLQAPLNYAKTAEQIWLDNNPNYWSPSTAADNQVTYAGNQLNPWMIATPVKGDPNNNYKGGANPAELAWYFLLPAMDSGFFYFGENIDDDVKPVLAFDNSLAFSQSYVQANLAQDRTGPSVWIPQRYPYDPGSVNGSKSEGYTVQWYNKHFAIYTYAYDVSGVASINVMIRPHTSGTLTANDDTYKVIYPAAMAGNSNLSITLANVGGWTAYPMAMRDLHPVMNGVAWIPDDQTVMGILPALDTGNLYYAYFGEYNNQLLDYYIQAVDSKGNITDTDIQQVYVGTGSYNVGGKSGYTEAVGGSTSGTEPFITATADAKPTTAMPDFLPPSGAYSSTQSVQILDGSAGATIYYTTDGSTPTTSSPVYSSPVSVNGSMTLKAIAVAGGLPTSGMSAARYMVGTVTPMPTFSPAAGVFTSAQSVTLADAASAAIIHYTTDGSAPTPLSPVYSKAILVSTTTTIQALAVVGSAASAISSATFTIVTEPPPIPTGLSASLVTSNNSVALTWTASAGASSYNVFRATSAAGPFTTAIGSAPTASYNDTTVASSTTYYYEVTAVNVVGQSGDSAPTSITTGKGVPKSPYTSMYLRGTMNTWGLTTPMTLVGNDMWQVTTTLTPSTAYSYKFDTGTWANTSNWGSGSTAGVAAVAGGNIAYTAGTGTSYTFTFNDSTLAYSVAAATTLAPPTGLTGIAANGAVTLNWTASANATGYAILRNGAPLSTSATTSYVDSTVSPSTTYSYTVEATDNANDVSAPSTAVSVTTPPPVVVGIQPPTGVTASAVTSSGFTLNWTAPSTGAAVAGYQVWVTNLAYKVSSTSYMATNLESNTTYNVVVRAYDAQGNYSTLTPVIKVTTVAGTGPSVPASLKVSATTNSSVTLTWNPSTDSNATIVGYQAWLGDKAMSVTGTSASFTGLAAATSYYATVRALDSKGTYSPLAPVVVAKTTGTGSLLPPTAVNASALTTTGFTINWTPPATTTGIAGYQVWIGNSAYKVPAPGTHYVATGLKAATTYHIAIRSYDAAGNWSALTTSVAVTTP